MPLTMTTYHKIGLRMDELQIPHSLERLQRLGKQKKCGNAIGYFKDYLIPDYLATNLPGLG